MGKCHNAYTVGGFPSNDAGTPPIPMPHPPLVVTDTRWDRGGHTRMATESETDTAPTPLMTIIESIRRPEYTGTNRCTPCTIVNLAIAAGLTVGAWLFTPILAVVVAAISVAAIWLRGYLVPYTPQLTKRYLPDRVLAVFDKQPTPSVTREDFDVETTLIEDGVLEATPDGHDLHVTPEFHREWRSHMRDTDRDRDQATLAWMLDIDPDRLALEPTGSAIVARIDGEWVGQWESRPAFVADVAAAATFENRDSIWASLPTWARSDLLGGLRLFLERCPTCDGDVVLEQSVKQSCCRDIDVLVLSCQGCGDRLFETPLSELDLPEDPETSDPATDSPTA